MTTKLSYIIATRNRFAFLQICLKHLLDELQPDEEIVVVDGNSTDGSKKYLQQLFEEGKIHQFVSEPDHNQAHAWNKAMLMAKGQIIKKIIDDDVFDYEAIRTCSRFMLKKPQVDVCISNSFNADIHHPENLLNESRLAWYKNWKAGKIRSFTFSDVHMLIRRSSLSYIGLYDTQFVMIDWEYSLRISWLKCNIAFFTGCNAISVGRLENVTSSTNQNTLKTEDSIGRIKYDYEGDDAEISLYSKLKIQVGTFLSERKRQEVVPALPAENALKNIYESYYQKLRQHNQNIKPEFIL